MLRFPIRALAGSLVAGAMLAVPGCAIPEAFRNTAKTDRAEEAAGTVVDQRSELVETLLETTPDVPPETPIEVPVAVSQGPAVALSAWSQATPSSALPAPVVIDEPVGINGSSVATVAEAGLAPVDGDADLSQAAEVQAIEPAAQSINLGSALAMTAGQNPEVNFARQRIVEAFAQLQAADAMWLPSIRAGGNYNKHEGRIQDVAGQIIETSRGSVYTGLGSQAVGAASPAVPGLLMNFHFSDAIFEPRVASQTVAARRQASRAVTNDLLMETAIAYVDLLEAMQTKAVIEQTLDNADSLARLTTDFAEAGQGLRADADRANVELSFRNIESRRADEVIRVASVRLSRLLHADAAVTLLPVEPALVPIDLVTLNAPVSSMVSMGLLTRPELAEAKHLVRAAIERYQREKYAPFVPSVLLGMSYGGNGGGIGGDIDNFGDRLDVDAAAWWEIRNLGYGEHAARTAACSRLEQAKWQQIRTMDQVAAEVAQAYAEVSARREQIILAQSAIMAADDSYRRNSERIRDGQGLPIEVLQAIQALDSARQQYIRIIADYNRSQFRLQRALGWPVEAADLSTAS